MSATKIKERRSRQRILFETPAKVTAGQHSIAASTKDITDRGLFLFADARLQIGSEIDIVIATPKKTIRSVSVWSVRLLRWAGSASAPVHGKMFVGSGHVQFIYRRPS